MKLVIYTSMQKKVNKMNIAHADGLTEDIEAPLEDFLVTYGNLLDVEHPQSGKCGHPGYQQRGQLVALEVAFQRRHLRMKYCVHEIFQNILISSSCIVHSIK